MGTKSFKRVIVALFAVVSWLCLCQGAFASVAIQPFLCAASGSVARWVTVQGHNAIGVTVQQSGNKGGGKYEGLQQVAGNSTASVTIIPTATSSNVSIQLIAKTSGGKVVVSRATSTSGNTYTWSLAQLGLTSSEKIEKMAIFAQNTTNSPGSIFLYHFVLNGSQVTNQITTTAGCLPY